MGDESDSYNQMMADQLILLETLYEVLHTSGDAEIVRLATAALTRTQSGVNYLVAHPITL